MWRTEVFLDDGGGALVEGLKDDAHPVAVRGALGGFGVVLDCAHKGVAGAIGGVLADHGVVCAGRSGDAGQERAIQVAQLIGHEVRVIPTESDPPTWSLTRSICALRSSDIRAW